MDVAENIRYAQHFTRAAAPLYGLHPTVGELNAEQQSCRERVSGALASAESSRSTLRMSAGGRRDVVDRAGGRLVTLFELVWPLRNDPTFDLDLGYPAKVKKSIGLSMADIQQATERALSMVTRFPQVPNGAAWKTELEALLTELKTALETTSSQTTGKLGDTKELRAAIAAWKDHYGACKLILRGLLKRAGREAEWKALLLDLQVGGSSRASGAGVGGEAAAVTEPM